MFYHASPVEGIKILEPRVSNHEKPMVYFSEKKEYTLVYLSNAVQKYCIETNYHHEGNYHKWASYGFNDKKIQVISEYYPNALEETYVNVSGYIYGCNDIVKCDTDIHIPFAWTSNVNNAVDYCEYIQDAYQEILKAEKTGSIIVRRYDDLCKNQKFMDWLKMIIQEEYTTAIAKDSKEYVYFLANKFESILKTT